MNLQKIRENLLNPSYRDLVIIGLATLILIILGLTVHWTEYCVNVLYRWQNYPLDDIVISLVVTAFLLMGYAIKRKREHIDFIKKLQHTEDEFQKTNHRVEVLLKSSSAVLFNLKATGDFDVYYISDNIQQLIGYTKEEFFVKDFWFNNVHPEDLSRIFTELSEVYETGFVSMQYRFQHKDQSWRWMQSDMKCLFDENKNPTELLGTWLDITEEKKLQQVLHTSNERFELASKATRDIIYDWDLVINDVSFSDEIFRSFGYEKGASKVGLHWWEEKIHPEDHDEVLRSVTEVLNNKGDSWSGNYRFRLADDSYANIFDRGFVVYSAEGLPLRWIGSMADISILKKTEAELKVALLKAEESAKAKSEFLANMSHEIRTPLNGIVGMTEMALETNLNAEQKRYLEIVKKSCDSLMSLINDILDFSKIDAGKLELAPVPFSLRDEIPHVMQPLGLKAYHKKLEFIFSIYQNVPDMMFGDIQRIQQIITNLAGNAIKFTEEGEVVLKVQLQALNNEEATLLFSISDTGIGIPQHKMKSVFEEFTQADGSTTRKYGGTGLGLAISKRLVELMGGSIWVESKENEGSTFYFTTVMQLQKQQLQSRFVALPVLENTSVLVVEDNRLSSQHMMEVLTNFGMKPELVARGEEALDTLKKGVHLGKPFPLMILDLSLPGKFDGFDVAEYVTTHVDLKQTNIIVVSMSQKASDRERLAQLGVTNYFNKPFSQSDLLDCIQNTLLCDAQPRGEHITQYIMASPSIPLNTTGMYKILLVEDNLVNQEVAVSMLAKKGHRIVIANNGEEAVALYKKEAFDFILMDVQMPVMNGYEATASIRELEKNKEEHTLIIGLTANAMIGDREKCIESGMDEYLSKPVRMNELYTLIEKVKHNQASDEAVVKNMVSENPLVNLKPLLENLENDLDALDSILNQYESRAMRQMNDIAMHVQNENISAIIMPAHSLKGQAMHVEMHAVISLGGKIEALALANKFTELKELVPSLQNELTLGLQALDLAWSELRKEKVA